MEVKIGPQGGTGGLGLVRAGLRVFRVKKGAGGQRWQLATDEEGVNEICGLSWLATAACRWSIARKVPTIPKQDIHDPSLGPVLKWHHPRSPSF